MNQGLSNRVQIACPKSCQKSKSWRCPTRDKSFTHRLVIIPSATKVVSSLTQDICYYSLNDD